MSDKLQRYCHHPLKLVSSRFKTDKRNNCSTQHIIRLWNSLLQGVVIATVALENNWVITWKMSLLVSASHYVQGEYPKGYPCYLFLPDAEDLTTEEMYYYDTLLPNFPWEPLLKCRNMILPRLFEPTL